MNRLLASAFAATLLVASPVALTGCQTETQREVESDGDVDYDTEIGIDDDLQEDAEAFGNEVEEGARQVGEDIERGARNAGDAIDENIDIGDNAGTPEVDDNN